MTKRVQLIGHDFAGANAFIGLAREVTVDYDNWELRLHDGSTPGGAKILNRDQNDNRYQARSVELDGLLGWEPSDRGIAVRLGPSNYALRQIQVVEGELTITNPNGFGGHFILGLPDTVTSDLTFSGALTLSGAVAATGGITGNVEGNLTGNVTGNVEGNLTGNVSGNLTGNTSGTHTGGLNTSAGTVVMGAGQILLGYLANEILNYITAGAIPVGGIIPYSGELDDVPLNWYICDGTNGTPDLRGKFIIGTNATYPIGLAGGAATHEHTLAVDSGGAHTHTGTTGSTTLTVAQLPPHKHGNGVTNTDDDLYCYGSLASPTATADSIDDNSSNGTLQGYTETIGGGDGHDHSISIDSGGAHSHSGTAAAASSLPPYYSLYYIMRGS